MSAGCCARQYSPNGSAIGKQVSKILPDRRGRGPRVAWEIVGVVADEKGSGLESPTDVSALMPALHRTHRRLGIVVKGDGEERRPD
jgi:hypothetical protein